MNIQKFDAFLKNIEESLGLRAEQVTELHFIRQEVEEARRLSQLGERRIALENLLENFLEVSVPLRKSAIDLAEDAFGTRLSSYEKKLIYLHRMQALQNSADRNTIGTENRGTEPVNWNTNGTGDGSPSHEGNSK